MNVCDTSGVISWLCTCPVPQGLAQWFVALGTVGAVFVATCGPLVRSLWNRPKIEFYINEKDPLFVSERKDDVQSSNSDKIFEIKIGIKNIGRSSAGSSSEVHVESFYKQRDKSFVVEDNFPAVYCKDINGKLPTLIPQRLVYIPIAFIKNSARTEVEEESDRPQQNEKANENDYNLYFNEENLTLLGRGRFIIPIQFMSSKISKTGYLKLYWDSKEPELTKKVFSAEFIDERKFNSLTKKEV